MTGDDQVLLTEHEAGESWENRGEWARQAPRRDIRRLRNILHTCPECWLFDPAAPETGCSYQIGVGEAAGPGCGSRRPFGRRSVL